MISPQVDRETEIGFALTNQVAGFDYSMLAHRWWSTTRNGVKNAERWVRGQELRGLLIRYQALLPPLPPIYRPLLEWHPGDRVPNNYYEVEYAARTRVRLPARPVTVVAATKEASRRFGGVPGKPCGVHELILSFVFAHHTVAATRRDWLGESTYAKDRREKKLPDALLCHDGDIRKPYRAIESCGTGYTAAHIRSFVEDFAIPEQIPFELW